MNERQKFSWQRQFFPGFTIVSLVLLARILGLFQVLELRAFDLALRLRPPETQDEKILIVTIDENDIEQEGRYPISDGTMADLLEVLSDNNPRVIGLDLLRNLPIEPGYEDFREGLETLPNIIGAERVTNRRLSTHTLSPDNIGIIDFPLDSGNLVRRTYLGAFPPADAPDDDRFRCSLALLLA